MKKKDKKRFEFNERFCLFLIGLLVLIAIILIVFNVVKKINVKNEELISELHNYFTTKDLNNCEGLFNYSDKKIDFDSVDSSIKNCVAYQKANISNVETITYNKTKNKDTCTQDGMTFKANEDSNECEVKIIPKNIIDESYKKIFGKEITDNNSFKADNLNICYLKDDSYYCGLSESFVYNITNGAKIYRVIEKTIKKGSSITIYDYFAKVNNNECYTTYTSTSYDSNCTNEYLKNNKINYKFLRKNGTQYKHVYEKAEDGSYYWVSSEPIKPESAD